MQQWIDRSCKSKVRGAINKYALRLTAAMRETLRAEPLADPDYVELVDAETLEPVTRLRGACLALLAVRIGGTRLIDNLLIEERDGAFVTSL